jgi:hypothetical protein
LAVAALQSENPIAQDGLHFDEAQLDSVALFKLQVTPHAPQSATEEPADLPVVRLMQSDEPSHRVSPDSHAVNEPVVVLEEPPPPLPPEVAPASAPAPPCTDSPAAPPEFRPPLPPLEELSFCRYPNSWREQLAVPHAHPNSATRSERTGSPRRKREAPANSIDCVMETEIWASRYEESSFTSIAPAPRTFLYG